MLTVWILPYLAALAIGVAKDQDLPDITSVNFGPFEGQLHIFKATK